MASASTTPKENGSDRELDSKDMYHVVMKETSHVGTTVDDVGDMYRMGKEQQFRRIFRMSTMVMFTSMIQATWEVVLVANSGGLVNGGLAGLFWSYIWTFVGFIPIVMSLAEMASMAPTSGGQYHWVSEFAPPRLQRFLSYFSGWMATTSWQAGTAGGSFMNGIFIQAVVVAYRQSYAPTRWQGTLCAFAVSLLGYVINTFGYSQLPRIQKAVAFPHALGWMAVIIFLWVLAPHASAKDVFTGFSSLGWEPMGLSLMVGQITSVYFLILSDSAAHLSEEVKSAGKAVPRAMMWSFSLNSLVGFIVLVSFVFAIPSIDDVLDLEKNPSGFPVLYVFKNASSGGAIVLIVIIYAVMLTGVCDSTASTSRQTFAFARDGGLPFNKWLSKVSNEIPHNSILFTVVFSCLLALINLGSTVAFNAIISLQLMALMASYSISIGCVFYERIRGGHRLPASRWSLGKAGIVVNGIGFFYSLFILFWTGWPGMKDVTRETFNWSSVMFAAVTIISMSYYYLHGRKTYVGPVVLVRTESDVTTAKAQTKFGKKTPELDDAAAHEMEMTASNSEIDSTALHELKS